MGVTPLQLAIYVAPPNAEFWNDARYLAYARSMFETWEEDLSVGDFFYESDFTAHQEIARKRLLHAQARSIECPTCGSSAGRCCRSASGKPLGKDDHVARVRAAMADAS